MQGGDEAALSSRQRRLIGFGNNYFYALGGGREISLNDAVAASECAFQEEIEDIQCTTTSTLFLTETGKVYQVGMLHGVQWKKPTQIPIPLPKRVDEIACGRHVCVARVGVAVVSWGAGHFGQLGQGPHVSHLTEPQIIRQLLPQAIGSPVAQLSAGAWHICALTENGRVFAWGSNRRYQCGMKSPSTLVYPQPVEGNVVFSKVVCGKSHSIGLERTTAKVYTWGASAGCGHSSRKTSIAPPRLVEALQRVVIVDVAAGDAHSMALTGGGRVFSWGFGAEGQLGVGGPPPPMIPRPKLVGDLDFVAVAAGQQKSEKEQGITPSQLANIPKITSVHCAGSYSMAVSSAGHLYTWGYNDGLVLGHPKPEQEDLPLVEVPATHAVPSRILQGQTFDSRHNVLLPKRVDGLSDLKVELVAGGPNHMWVCGRVREANEGVVVGRTLYEMQRTRGRAASTAEAEELSDHSNDGLMTAATEASGLTSIDGPSTRTEGDRHRSSSQDGRGASGRSLRSMSMSRIMKKLTPSRKNGGEEARPKLRKVFSAAFGSK